MLKQFLFSEKIKKIGLRIENQHEIIKNIKVLPQKMEKLILKEDIIPTDEKNSKLYIFRTTGFQLFQ
jgi:hypothetical protein